MNGKGVYTKKDIIKQLASENNISLDRISIVNADNVITMEDNPRDVVKDKSDCSGSLCRRIL